MLRKVGIGLGALAVLVVLTMTCVLVFVSPEWEVERSRTIAAPVARVHAAVADLETWSDWTAWSREADPQASWTHEGAAAGLGAVMRWDGPRFGRGRLEIVQSKASEGIEYEMVLESEGDLRVEGSVSYQPVEHGTRVTWRDRGHVGRNPFSRIFKPVLRKSLGVALAESLEGLARRLEARTPPPPA